MHDSRAVHIKRIGKYYTFGFWETITLHYPYFLGIVSLLVRLQMDYWLLKLHTRLILKTFYGLYFFKIFISDLLYTCTVWNLHGYFILIQIQLKLTVLNINLVLFVNVGASTCLRWSIIPSLSLCVKGVVLRRLLAAPSSSLPPPSPSPTPTWSAHENSETNFIWSSPIFRIKQFKINNIILI